MHLIFPLALLLLLPVALRSAQVLPAKKVAHFLLLPKVYLNGKGPFRMIIDTGAASSSLRPRIAASIGAAPLSRIEQVTLAGSSVRPAGIVEVRVAGAPGEKIEMVFSPVAYPDADGVLGQSWLRLHSYLLDFDKGQVTLDGLPPSRGLQLPFHNSDGRPSLHATVDGEPHQLVLDSGAPALILFRSTPRYRSRVQLNTNSGTTEARLGAAKLKIGDGFHQSIQALELPGPSAAGLLPASAFRSVYIARDASFLILVPR